MTAEKPFLVAAFYKFVVLENLENRRDFLLELCRENNVKGTILLALEGINSTICGEENALHRVLDVLQSDAQIGEFTIKFSRHDEQPFARLKVKIKAEIVTLGMPQISPTKAVGTYVSPRDWNDLISQEDVLVLDTRNDYEVEVGSFANAINPQTRSFRQFPDAIEKLEVDLEVDKKTRVAMFCTGGIRCEKASSLLMEMGFENVYHLQGGVLQYLEEVASDESLWRGECFVFDNRVSLDHDLARGEYSLCEGCGVPVKMGETNCAKCADL